MRSRRSSRCRCRSRTAAAVHASRRRRRPSTSRCPTRSARSSPGSSTTSGWTVASAGRRRRARVPISRATSRVLFRRFVSFGEDVTRAYIDAHRGARHPAPARRRQGVSRPRGSGDDPRRARGDRVARRRAVGVRDAEGIALRDRRRAAARVPAPVRRASIRSGFRRSSAATPARSSRSPASRRRT